MEASQDRDSFGTSADGPKRNTTLNFEDRAARRRRGRKAPKARPRSRSPHGPSPQPQKLSQGDCRGSQKAPNQSRPDSFLEAPSKQSALGSHLSCCCAWASVHGKAFAPSAHVSSPQFGGWVAEFSLGFAWKDHLALWNITQPFGEKTRFTSACPIWLGDVIPQALR